MRRFIRFRTIEASGEVSRLCSLDCDSNDLTVTYALVGDENNGIDYTHAMISARSVPFYFRLWIQNGVNILPGWER